MSSQHSRGAISGAGSSGVGYSQYSQPGSLDEAALQRYHEARRRAEAAAIEATTSATSAAVPSSVRNIVEFVKLAAAREEARESETAVAELAPSAHEPDRTKAAEESALCSAYEDRIFQVDVRLQDLRLELVSVEAQEAAESSEWQDRYFEEVQVARKQRQRMLDLQGRIASAEGLQAEGRVELDRWLKEAAECQTQLEAERKRFHDEFKDAKTHAELSHSRVADFERRVRQSEEVVAQSTREKIDYEEASATAHAHERMADLQTRAADAALALIIEKELQATALQQSLEAEWKAMLAREANILTVLESEARAEVSSLSELREEISQFSAEQVHNAESLRQLEAFVSVGDNDLRASKDSQVDANAIMEHLSKFIESWKDDTTCQSSNHCEIGKDSTSTVEAVRNVQEFVLERRRKASSMEAMAKAEVVAECALAEAVERTGEKLQLELLEESHTHRYLQSELMALSICASSTRALVAAKDASIAELEAALQRLATTTMEHQESTLVVGRHNPEPVTEIAGLVEVSARPSSAIRFINHSVAALVSPRKVSEPNCSSQIVPPSEKRFLHSSRTPREPDKLQTLHTTLAARHIEKRPVQLDDQERNDWRRLESIVKTPAASVDVSIASTGSSASDKAKLQSSGLASGKAVVHAGGSAASVDNIPRVFAKFRASLNRSEVIEEPEPQPQPIQPILDSARVEPNWEHTKKVMTDQLRHDLSQLRQVFSQLVPDDVPASTRGHGCSLGTQNTKIDASVPRTRSPPLGNRDVRRWSTDGSSIRVGESPRTHKQSVTAAVMRAGSGSVPRPVSAATREKSVTHSCTTSQCRSIITSQSEFHRSISSQRETSSSHGGGQVSASPSLGFPSKRTESIGTSRENGSTRFNAFLNIAPKGDRLSGNPQQFVPYSSLKR